MGGGADPLLSLDGLPGVASDSEFASFSVRGRGPRDNLLFVDDFPFDKAIHFDATLGEEEDVGGGGRFSIFAPNVINGAEFSPGGWQAAYGGRAGSLLKLEVADGNPSPSASFRYDLAGYEVGYDGPINITDEATMLFSARRLDFGALFETIEELDIGEPVLRDIIFKSVIPINQNNTFEVLLMDTHEKYTRGVEHVSESPNFEDTALQNAEQDSDLYGLTLTTLLGETAVLTNKVYYRKSDKLSSEGEAYPDLVPEGTPASEYPSREDIITISEGETEIGWRSDFEVENQLGMLSVGARITQIELDYSTFLDGEWNRFVYDSDDYRPDSQQKFIVLTPESLNSVTSLKEVNYAGYNQDLYLYLKTLGLKDKEIEVQVHEQDYYHTPANAVEFPLSNKKGDELIEWKNNQIKIDNNGEALKQFKIGDKNRYEEAQKDEKEDDYKKWYDEQISKGYYFVGFDPTEKYGADLELYIHFPEKGEFKPNKDNQFAKLTLTDKTMIMDAYFATTEKHKVQTDAPATKKNANPTGKVTQYIKQDKGVLGQTIQLVAECPNLEGKKVTFQIFEKTPLLGEEDKPLTLINKKGEEKTRIEANVKESFAVAEVKLQHCKEDADNEDWARILFPDTVKKKKDLKFSELYIKVEATKNVFIIKSNGEFLKDNPFKFSTNTCSCNKCINYQDVKSNPILNTQTYENKNRFKKAKRYRSSGKVYYHRGTDVLAKTGTDVHSLLCGEVANFGHRTSFKTNQYAKDSFGNTVVIKSKDKDDKIIYIKYCHLDSVSVKKGDKIIHNQIIAKSGSTGNAATILYTSGSKKGKLKNGIKEEHRHIHIEASRNKNFSNSRTGNENDPETYMKTKFDKDGKVIE